MVPNINWIGILKRELLVTSKNKARCVIIYCVTGVDVQHGFPLEFRNTKYFCSQFTPHISSWLCCAFYVIVYNMALYVDSRIWCRGLF